MNRFTIKPYYRYDKLLSDYVAKGFIIWDTVGNCVVDFAGKPVLNVKFVTDIGESIPIIHSHKVNEYQNSLNLMTLVTKDLNQGDKDYLHAISQY